jgi:hypothetical protein
VLGRRQWGRLSFGDFSFAQKNKLLARRGELPARDRMDTNTDDAFAVFIACVGALRVHSPINLGLRPQRNTMSSFVASDIITIIGTSYFQPIADLINRMLKRPATAESPVQSSHFENGYAAASTVLLVATLESFVSRVRFLRNSEVVSGKDVPDQLLHFFPDLPNHKELAEVFLLRNIVVHNHVWHLETSATEERNGAKIASPKDLKFQTKKNYDAIVNPETRKPYCWGSTQTP